MKTVPDNKYHLRDLYQEISLFDRKIRHCRNYEAFDSEADRSLAVSKLESQREVLTKIARGMVERGVEYSVNDLPLSMKESMTATAKENL
jgi:hypothetical protein